MWLWTVMYCSGNRSEDGVDVTRPPHRLRDEDERAVTRDHCEP
jgi:hypothetical protein